MFGRSATKSYLDRSVTTFYGVTIRLGEKLLFSCGHECSSKETICNHYRRRKFFVHTFIACSLTSSIKITMFHSSLWSHHLHIRRFDIPFALTGPLMFRNKCITLLSWNLLLLHQLGKSYFNHPAQHHPIWPVQQHQSRSTLLCSTYIPHNI